MKVSKADIPDEANLMPLLWEMIKDFYIPDGTDEFWDMFRMRAEEVDKRCNHSRLGQIMINALSLYLEEKESGRKCSGHDDYQKVMKR